MQQADGDRLGPGLANPAGESFDGFVCQLALDGAVVEDAFGSAEGEVPRDEPRSGGGEKVIEFWAVLAPDFEDVFKAFGGHEGGACALAFEQGVGRDRRTVDDLVGCDVGEYLDDGACGVFGRRAGFACEVAFTIPDKEVGERAAGVDADLDVRAWHSQNPEL